MVLNEHHILRWNGALSCLFKVHFSFTWHFIWKVEFKGNASGNGGATLAAPPSGNSNHSLQENGRKWDEIVLNPCRSGRNDCLKLWPWMSSSAKFIFHMWAIWIDWDWLGLIGIDWDWLDPNALVYSFHWPFSKLFPCLICIFLVHFFLFLVVVEGFSRGSARIPGIPLPPSLPEAFEDSQNPPSVYSGGKPPPQSGAGSFAYSHRGILNGILGGIQDALWSRFFLLWTTVGRCKSWPVSLDTRAGSHLHTICIQFAYNLHTICINRVRGTPDGGSGSIRSRQSAPIGSSSVAMATLICIRPFFFPIFTCSRFSRILLDSHAKRRILI